MGFTHYYNYPTNIKLPKWNAFIKDIRKILANLPTHTATAGGDHIDDPLKLVEDCDISDKPPIVNKDMIWFNGAEELGHETFSIHRSGGDNHGRDNHGRDFCKTARKPYDLAVCTCLISLKVHFPNAAVSSDGGESDWTQALHYYESLFPDHNIPDGVWGNTWKAEDNAPITSNCPSFNDIHIV